MSCISMSYNSPPGIDRLLAERTVRYGIYHLGLTHTREVVALCPHLIGLVDHLKFKVICT